MRIGIVGGTGKEGLGLGLRWAQAGHDVIIGSRDPERARAKAAELAAAASGRRIEGMSNRDAAATAEVVVLTVPATGLAATLPELRAACADPAVTVCCYPRNCDSAAFYLGRDDLRSTRSKFVHLLVADLLSRERTVVLFTHRHSLEALKPALPPDLRVVLKPYVTHYSGAKTVVATAQSTVELVQTVLSGREAVLAAQVMVDGEFYGLRAPLGVPIVLGTQGFTEVIPLQLWEDEAELLSASADAIANKVAEWLPADV